MSETAQFYVTHLVLIGLASAFGYWCFGIANSSVDMLARTASNIGMVATTILVISAIIVIVKELFH